MNDKQWQVRRFVKAWMEKNNSTIECALKGDKHSIVFALQSAYYWGTHNETAESYKKR